MYQCFDRGFAPPICPALEPQRQVAAASTLKRVEIKGEMIETMNEVVVEVEGQEKPAVVAESLGRLVF